MSSYFTLSLDTTGPEINIISPRYTIPGIDTEMRIVANEPVSTYQEIYIIDAAGKRHDLIFAKGDCEFYGIWNFQQCALGIAQVFAQLKDTVFNPSNVAVTTIHIREKADIYAVVDCSRRLVLTTEETYPLHLRQNCRMVEKNEQAHTVIAKEVARKMNLVEEVVTAE